MCVCVCVCVCAQLQLCAILCNSMDCSPHQVLCPWDFPGKNTGADCHFLLQGIFAIQGLNPHLLHWQASSLALSHLESLCVCIYIYIYVKPLLFSIFFHKSCLSESEVVFNCDFDMHSHIMFSNI